MQDASKLDFNPLREANQHRAIDVKFGESGRTRSKGEATRSPEIDSSRATLAERADVMRVTAAGILGEAAI